MDAQLWLNVAFRWLHVGAAIVLFGGTLFQYFVLVPSVRELPDVERKELHNRVLARWRKVVGITIGLLLISGFYNYLVVAIPGHRESPLKGLYHALMGIKILLGFAVFFLASALTGRSAAFEGMRAQSRKWMAVSLLLATVVVALAGYLKVGVPPVSTAPPTEAAADE